MSENHTNGTNGTSDPGLTPEIEQALARLNALPVSEERPEASAEDEHLYRRRLRDAFLETRSVRWWDGHSQAFGKSWCEEENPSEHPLWNEAWRSVCSTLLERGAQGPIILLAGNTRTGKTLLATGAGLRVIRRKRKVLYNTWFRVGLDFEESMKPDSEASRRVILDDLCRPWLLILDEISAGIDSESSARLFRQIIIEREGACHPTLLISNHSLEEISRHLPETVISRIEHSDTVINFNWSRLD